MKQVCKLSVNLANRNEIEADSVKNSLRPLRQLRPGTSKKGPASILSGFNGIFNSMTYQDKLKDPRWQKKRLEILSRDNWTCTLCGDDSSTLHVHHKYYEKGKNPWDYPSHSLATLCWGCHENESEQEVRYSQLVIDTLKRSPFFSDQWRELASGIIDIKMVTIYPPEVIASAYAFAFRDPEMQILIVNEFFETLRKKNPNPVNF